jgi:hypothetical protein
VLSWKTRIFWADNGTPMSWIAGGYHDRADFWMYVSLPDNQLFLTLDEIPTIFHVPSIF